VPGEHAAVGIGRPARLGGVVSGDGTFAGTNYQASVIAFVFVHVITEAKLRWLPTADDTPSAVSGEVKGPGDDARVEFGSGDAAVEIQAKHGLKPQKAVEAFQAIKSEASAADVTAVLLVVDSSSSNSVRRDLRRDLDRMRSGRTDGIRELTRRIVADLGDEGASAIARVHVRVVDVDSAADNEAARALELLSDHLEDPSKALAAWAILERDAASMCAERSRRTRKALLDLLGAAGITLRPPRRTRKWHDDLRYSKKLLGEDEPAKALDVLNLVEADIKGASPDGEVLYRINQHRASAHLQLGDYDEAKRYAQKALDHNPEGIHALVNLANAQALGGDVAAAVVTADRAIGLHPQDATAWLMRYQLSLSPGQKPVVAPPDVTARKEFRTELVRVYLFNGDATRARDVSAALIQEGDRSVAVLLLRVEALLADVDAATLEERTLRSQEVARLCSEVIDGGERSDRRTLRALVARSVAHRMLGQVSDSEEDIESARMLRPDDVRILAEAAQARIQAGREDAALDLLVGPAVDESPFLLAMRASLLATRGETARARKDLDAVLQALPGVHEPDIVRSAAAEAALALEDGALAKLLISDTSPAFSKSVHHAVVRARLAVLEGDMVRAESLYREAARRDPPHRSALLAELGARFLHGKKPAEAVRVFQDAQPLPPRAERDFVRGLVATERLGDAHGQLERIATRGAMPDWAVAIAAQIALRRNDPVNAATHLEDLIARGVATQDGRLMLIETLLELDQPERARPHADSLVGEKDLTPRERTALAQLQARLGNPLTAIELGLQAYREAPHDATINRAFASLVFLSKSKPLEVEQIEAGTHASLRNEEGRVLEYLLLADTGGQRLPNEISVEDARAAGLLGLRVGDTFTQDRGAWFEKRWRVERLQPVVKFLVNDIVANFGSRFPSEQFFATGFTVNTQAPGVGDFQPMIVATHERGRQLKQLLTLYRQQCLPLGPVAKLAGVTVGDLIGELTRPDSEWPLFVEWSDNEGLVASRAAARTDGPVVLTRSALLTAEALQLIERVAAARRLVAPRSLRDELRSELVEAGQRVVEGWSSIAAGDRGLVIEKRLPGDAGLVRKRDVLRTSLAWFDANVEALPRPLEAFGDPQEPNSETRSNLGESAHDAVELARHLPGVLWADDLGLRIVAKSLDVSSCSSVSLLQVLSEKGVVAGEERDRLLVDLVERHYNAVPVSPELLLECVAPSRTALARQQTFSLLSGPSLDVATAAVVLVRAIKSLALKIVTTSTTAQLARQGLEGMAHRFSAAAATQALSREADRQLSLLPSELRVVKAACAQFSKASQPLIDP
jgi:tetratricopeptide (TPR) repeat protein